MTGRTDRNRTEVRDAPVDLGRDVFLRRLLRELAGTLENVVGLSEASGYISVVGGAIGEQIDADYRAALSVDRLDRDQVRDVLVDLKRRIEGDFFVLEEHEDRIVLGNRACPFGAFVAGRPSLCMMTSNVFGAVAAQNLGYARVEIEEAIAKGSRGLPGGGAPDPLRRRRAECAGIFPDRGVMAVGGPGSDLEFLQEAALVVTAKGRVRGANAAARDLFGAGLAAGDLFDLVADEAAVSAYLRRASRSTASHAGAVILAPGAGGHRCRALAARLRRDPEGETVLVLRLLEAGGDRFGVLNRQLAETERILRRRQRENLLLKEALAENRVLVRELQHRVKNFIQQMLSLIKMSAARHDTPEVAEVVATATRRLRAMSAAQEALYQTGRTSALSARDFLGPAVQATASALGRAGRLDAAIADGEMTPEEAHCLALIANELVTNAMRHGTAGAGTPVAVSFASDPEGHVLEVRDRGPGFDGRATSRSSGLSLVRALCRQIGATLDVVHDRGTRCSVRFRSSLDETDG